MALLWKMICNLGDPMSLRHPVSMSLHNVSQRRVVTYGNALQHTAVSMSLSLSMSLSSPHPPGVYLTNPPLVQMGHVTHMNGSCHAYACVMLHIWMSHITHMNAACVTYVNAWYHAYEWVMSHIWMSHVTHINETTGWRRLIGSPKLQIISHKRATKYRSLLRKMTYKDKGSYESLPSCRCDMKQFV